MKYERIPTRRKPVRKTFYARLFNKTKTKKQRAAAATADAEDMEEGGINISRSLTIIFAIHILAIGMIFIHNQYLSGRTPAPDSSASSEPAVAEVTTTTRNNDLPMLSSGDKPYMVRKGDNYAIIAAKFSVDESELREMNRDADIRAGAVLRIPQSRRIVAETPPEVAAIRDQERPSDSELGLVEIVPDIRDPQVVRPVDQDTAPPVATSGRTHTIVSGDNIWRISNKYKVDQNELMALNNITDPTKLRIGQVIKLP
ncbi:MAG: LysM peptidoglycan-binding domain-containing protein [Akkermansiaceae bacterium]|jgi:LysM repeat protein|nr:LysM peptidoglycan-binding domain-containing protein [Akkermansiaceae bacterium]MDP4647865.1 LysM peptidoglycan-binding domain-containing protein [Akkermansiaceae bacterium]MDP4722029.1 LysM peptidoglycan-binding domain-containing protein [Akkermansiaceae bacterium]MDP4780518.1 LysM peptidoglycan-binding domain-containing protein [Akkermansiaceae bacterium]MDP4846118.1 LysM peptidoglycan-binding domain-containing protein [Akkermansiaceae bacterium]